MELADNYPYYLANVATSPNHDLEVTNKFTGNVVTRVALADRATIDHAIAAATAAFGIFSIWPAHKRQDILMHCVRRFEECFDKLAHCVCIEAGKPIKDSRGEVHRLIDTFRVAAEESVRIYGEYIPFDISPRTEKYHGVWKRVPIGPCSFISPFNFPLNLAAHKIAPAIAVGCPFVLKPASSTPLGALMIGEILAETNLPPGTFSILPCRRDDAELMTTDERLKLLSFTGSPDVGWELKSNAGKKKVTLELGGNAAVIVDRDSMQGDAVDRIVTGAFYQSGQSCISVQRILVHESIYTPFRDALVNATRTLKMGDPQQEDTFIGPLISEQAGVRLERWIQAAVHAGATILCGGTRTGSMLAPTLLEKVPKTSPLYCDEAFGPVAVLSSFHNFSDALDEVNDSVFGLQAGIFTRDLYKSQQAWDRLDVGSVVIGDVPSWRVDNMPYGGVKNSGLGREGIRWAIEDMTETRLMVIRSLNEHK